MGDRVQTPFLASSRDLEDLFRTHELSRYDSEWVFPSTYFTCERQSEKNRGHSEHFSLRTAVNAISTPRLAAALSYSLSRFPSLRLLDLTGSAMGPDAGRTLADGLASNASLTELYLGSNNLQDDVCAENSAQPTVSQWPIDCADSSVHTLA
jgi:hypothetical protein